jgi:hypothetical protein
MDVLTASPSRFLGFFRKGIDGDIPSAAMRMDALEVNAVAHDTKADRARIE